MDFVLSTLKSNWVWFFIIFILLFFTIKAALALLVK